jgi:hypothetical protein
VRRSRQRIFARWKRSDIITSAKSSGTRKGEQKLKLARKYPQQGEQMASIGSGQTVVVEKKGKSNES